MQRTLCAGMILLALRSGLASAAINVRAKGAKGDGVTNDRAAFQSALNSAALSSGVVQVPPGRYLIDGQPLKLPGHVRVAGYSAEKTILIKGAALETGMRAEGVTGITLTRLQWRAQAGTPATWEAGPGQDGARFVHLVRCQAVRVTQCRFDSQTDGGELAMFNQCQFTLCDDVFCGDNVFLNTLGACTGMDGANGSPHGRRGRFERNTLLNFADTGIGLWTGAANCILRGNRFEGRLPNGKGHGFPVGIDVAGGKQSVIERNILSGGHIGVRLFDPSHEGAYPIAGIVIRHNRIIGQQNYDATHPNWGIKVESDTSDTEVIITDNIFNERPPHGAALIGGSAAGKKTMLILDHNTVFSQTGLLINVPWFHGPLVVRSNGRIINPAHEWGSNHYGFHR